MTTLPLPAVQPAAKTAPGKSATAGQDAGSEGEFRDVLAGQVDKAKAGADTTAADKPGDNAAPAAEQEADAREAQPESAADAATAPAMPLIGLVEAGAALSGKTATRAAGVDATTTRNPAPAQAASATPLHGDAVKTEGRSPGSKIPGAEKGAGLVLEDAR